MIVALDLDDTLYRELDYVESGFRAVAAHAALHFDITSDTANAVLLESLAAGNRGNQFDDLLHAIDRHSIGRRNEMVQVYRQHQPDLKLPAASADALNELRAAGHRLFLVTDGNHHVQGRKVAALGLWDEFEHCYLTYRYGRWASKPSTRVFELMLKRTRAEAKDLVYIGDNPHKDFVGVRSLGASTIRIHTGSFKDDAVSRALDGDFHIDHISEVAPLVAQLSSGR